MLGGWGEWAAGRVAAAPGGAERQGMLAVAGGDGFAAAGWYCRLWGEAGDGGGLGRRFGGGPGGLAAALCRAHAELGPDAAGLLAGSFVLLALDLERGHAYLSRDRLGSRPLVFAALGGGVLFAEHECRLLELLPTTPAPERTALERWVDLGALPAGHTLYEGIRALGPGHRLELSPGRFEARRWWRPAYRESPASPQSELAESVREAAFAAIDRAAAGAAGPGLRLSGGLDSACVAAGLAERAGAAPIAVSAVFPARPETDERELIQKTARQTGVELELVAFDGSDSFFAAATAHVDRWRLPPATPNLFVWQRALAAARERGVDVLLDGEGGDELFGMAPELIADRLRSGRLPSAWRLAGRIPGMGPAPGRRLRLRALRVFGLGPLIPDPARRWRRRNRTNPHSLLPAAAAERHARALERDPGPGFDGPLWWRRLAAQLAGDDELGVAAHFRREAEDGGVERRHPFRFDPPLVEAMLAIPPAAQFDPVHDRPLLRAGLRGRIPEEVRCRGEKSYFSPLLVEALAGADGAEAGRLLGDPRAPVRAYLDPARLELLLARRERLRPGEATLLWRAAIADVWLRSLADRDLFRPCAERVPAPS